MSLFVLLVVCLVLGALVARAADVPRAMPAAINFWVLNVALPALVLVQVPRLPLDAALLFPALAPWAVLGGALLIFPWLGRRFGWTAGTVGALILTCGLGNTSFMGLPMIEALRGRDALGPAIIADQLGSFLALSTVGIAVAARYSGGAARAADLLKRVVTFPAFVALVVAFAVRGFGGWPDWAVTVLTRLGDTLTPLALFSVGLQFRFGHVAQHAPRIALGLSWKMLLAPLVVLGAGLALGLQGMPMSVTILQCATAPMISAGILAQQHNLNPALANAIVSVGIPLSLLTVPLWSSALG
jgi:malate permease and related proteins